MACLLLMCIERDLGCRPFTLAVQAAKSCSVPHLLLMRKERGHKLHACRDVVEPALLSQPALQSP